MTKNKSTIFHKNLISLRLHCLYWRLHNLTEIQFLKKFTTKFVTIPSNYGICLSLFADGMTDIRRLDFGICRGL